MTIERTDVAIIGAGPVGLFAVFECGMLKMRCHVVDALDVVGGQCAALYPEKPIYDSPGHPSIDAIDLIRRLEEQAAPFAPAYHLGARVEELARDGEDWIVTTSRGARIAARAVIVAAGVGAFGPNRPPVTRLAEFEPGCVHYLVRQREAFRGKRLVIAGGGGGLALGRPGGTRGMHRRLAQLDAPEVDPVPGGGAAAPRRERGRRCGGVGCRPAGVAGRPDQRHDAP